jgi:hypothetical protein
MYDSVLASLVTIVFVMAKWRFRRYFECRRSVLNIIWNISQADTDKDGRLSLTEMIENPYVFYSAIFSDEDDDYDIHDEFR